MVDFAKRAKDHEFGLDPIVRSLLDTDFYKMAMLQLIWKKSKTVNPTVTFTVKNRTKDVKLGEIINIDDLKAQLDYVKGLKFTRGEITWLRGNTFYGKRTVFDPEFINWLETDFQLSDYVVSRDETGQLVVAFHGTWQQATMWEIYALTIINTLRNRALMRDIPLFDLDVMFSRAKSKLWGKVEELQKLPSLGYNMPKISDFGTRRRFDFLWQEWVVTALKEGLGNGFVGTSNMHLAMKHDLEAIGTNAHELPMVYAALTETDEELLQSPYKVLEDWQDMYDGNMRIVLPDTFGTSAFLRNAPDWVKQWKGFRIDSKDNFEGAQELIDWWTSKGEDPTKHMIIHSDGLDVGGSVSSDIFEIQRKFYGQYIASFGWGTKATNDFVGCVPNKDDNFIKPISLVCKVTHVDGRSTVKLSDNWEKATGTPEEITRYKRVFGEAGHSEKAVEV